MFVELWSLAMLPFENLTITISMITLTMAIPTLLNLFRQEQGKKQMAINLPEIDIAAVKLIDAQEQNLAKMVQTLKQHPKLRNAHNLKKIGFRDEVHCGPYANEVSVVKTGNYYTLLMGLNFLDQCKPAQLNAVIAHELWHVEQDHYNLLSLAMTAFYQINEPAFQLTLLATIGLSFKNLVAYTGMIASSEQLSSVAMLLIASITIAQICKTQARSLEFQADQAVPLLEQDPKDLILAIEKMDVLHAKWKATHVRPKPPALIDLEECYLTWFHTHPSVTERKKALNLIDEPTANSPAARATFSCSVS